jgi:multisubunit Na+/H+ antiporter MnhB subunit
MTAMTARAVRRVVIGVFVLGIAGMIAFSIADNSGGALTAGLATAAASLCLMVASAVGAGPASAGTTEGDEEVQAAALEDRINGLVAAGAAEDEVRALVRAAVALGKARR